MAKVLITIHSLGTGGAERVALQFARWLVDAGHQVVLLTPTTAATDFYPLPPGVERVREAPLGGWSERLGPLRFPGRVLTLRPWLRRQRFDLAIGMTTLPALKLLLASRRLNLPVVVAERNYPGAKPLSPPWRMLRRWLYPGAALHLVQTDAIGAWLRQRRLAERPAVLANAIPWPLPSHAPRVEPCLQLAPGTRVLLAVGTKPHQKGFDLLVEAFALASATVPGWRLVIAGLESWPARWPAPPAAARPLLLGRVGNLADWYRRAELFVLSSRYEGFPNVLLEAMASGCACVALDCPTGPSELIEDGHNGRLLPAGSDPSQLAQALVPLMADGDARRRLGTAATAVRQRFSEERQRLRLLDLLNPWLAPTADR